MVSCTQLAQEAVATALRLGFGQQPAQMLKKEPVQDLQVLLDRDGSSFWGE